MAAMPERRPFQPSASELFNDALGHMEEIVRSEIRLAQAELREEGKKAVQAGFALAAGGVLALYAGLFLLFTVVYALALALPPWLASLIVTLLVAIPSAVMIGVGIKRVKQVRLKPEKTIQTTKETVRWAKEQVK
jgi:hypothetical protein